MTLVSSRSDDAEDLDGARLWECHAEATLEDEADEPLLGLAIRIDDHAEVTPPHDPHERGVVAVHGGRAGAGGVDVAGRVDRPTEHLAGDGHAAAADVGGDDGRRSYDAVPPILSGQRTDPNRPRSSPTPWTAALAVSEDS